MNQALEAVRLVQDALYQAVVEAGSHGIPAGYLYTAVSMNGVSLRAFEALMFGLVKDHKVYVRHNCYFAHNSSLHS